MLAALLLAGVFTLSACSNGSSSSPNTYTYDGSQTPPTLIAPKDRKPAENFDGSLLQGGTYDLAKYAAHKVTVVNFWGSWCGPCQIETPQFSQAYLAYRGKNVTFVGIAIKESSRGAPEHFVQVHKIAYPIVYDDKGETAVTLGNIPSQVAPYSVLLDRHHRVAGVYQIRIEPDELDSMLNKLIAEK